MSEASIIAQCQAGKEVGYQALYQLYVRYVLTIVRSYIRDANAHQDMTQDIFAQLFHKLHTYQPNKGEFKPWLRRVAVTQCLIKIRKDKNFPETFSVEDFSQALPDEQPHETQENFHQLSRDDIHNLLAQMPDGYRTVFLLVAIDEYKHHEVAELLGINANTSRSQYLKARRWLQEHILTNNNKQKYGLSI